MTVELQMLAWSIVLGFLHLGAAAMAATKVRGNAWNVGARDEEPKRLTGIPGRLDRAFQNFKETFPFFVAAVVITEFVSRTAGTQNSMSVVGAHMYFWARVVYFPLYAFGIPYIRTLVWLVSAAGIFMVLMPAILAP